MMPGMIMLWYGSPATIPSGWHLCDGTLGTPDLRDKFIVAAGSAYAPGAQGGSDIQSHAFTGDGHQHGYELYASCMEGNDRKRAVAASSVTGTTNEADNRPQYYALCYIQKL